MVLVPNHSNNGINIKYQFAVVTLCVDVYCCALSIFLLFHRLNHPAKAHQYLHNRYVVVYYVYPPI